MAKRPKDFSSVQGDLFQGMDQSPLESMSAPDLDLGDELRGAIVGAIRRAKQYGMSRERLIDAMNARLPELPKPLTVRQLNGWTATAGEDREFPLRYIAAFCAVVQDITPLRITAQALGYELVDARGLAAVELGKTVAEKAALAQRERELKERLMLKKW